MVSNFEIDVQYTEKARRPNSEHNISSLNLRDTKLCTMDNVVPKQEDSMGVIRCPSYQVKYTSEPVICYSSQPIRRYRYS